MFPRSRISSPSVLAMFALVGAGCAPRSAVVSAPVSVPGIRVVDAAANTDLDFETVVQRASRGDVVFFGEKHDDPEAQRVELGFLQAIGRTGRPVILSLEMFERDAQPLLNDYLAGRI